jgi:cysteine desulfurase
LSQDMTQAYLDYNATSPLDPEVQKVMVEALSLANASSFHRPGQKARHAVEEAREKIAATLSVEPGDLIFTSGGTESDNLAVRGVVMARMAERRHLAVSTIEHQAVLHTARHLEKRRCPVSYVPVDPDGVVKLDELEKAVTDQTALVSLMHVNNETGVIQPIQEAAKIAHAKGALFHVDAVQSYGKLTIHPEDLGVDLLTISAHKICGPKGAGALWIRKGVKIEALLHGGHQEKNIRPGTENVGAIAGFGKAVELAFRLRSEESLRVGALRDRLEKVLFQKIPDTHSNGDPKNRIYNTLNLSFDGLDGETLLMNLDLEGISVSTGSACTAGSVEPSHVLLAMGLSDSRARSAIRFSLGRFTTGEEIYFTIECVQRVVERLRKASTQRKPKAAPGNPFP